MNDYYGNEQGNQPPSSRQQQSGFDPNRSPSNQQLSASEIMVCFYLNIILTF